MNKKFSAISHVLNCYTSLLNDKSNKLIERRKHIIKINKKWLLLAFALTLSAVLFVSSLHATGIDGGYVGTSTCLSCHDGAPASDKTGFTKTGHPYKYRHTGGAAPTDPLTGLYTNISGNALLQGAWIDTSTLGDGCYDPVTNPSSLVICNTDGTVAWSAINYAIGGYGWKIRWGVKDATDAKTGYVWTSGLSGLSGAQYNLEGTGGASNPQEWSAYNGNTDKKNECAKCHQTNGMVFTGGYSCYTDPVLNPRTEPLGSNPGMSLVEDNSAAGGDDDGICETGEGCKIGGYRSMWTFDGVQCEACHGEGSNSTNTGHADGTGTQGVLTLAGGVEICAKCHIRAENTAATGAECDGGDNPAILTNGAKITDPWIGHHEQYNELTGYNNDGVHALLTCTTCHDPHKRATGVIASVAGALGISGDNTEPEVGAIKTQCADCHLAQNTLDVTTVTSSVEEKHLTAGVTCVDCHMAEATKTATNSPTTGWGRKGDLKTHIFDINPAGSSIVRSNGFTNIAQNYITPKYACGKCHDSAIYGSVIAGPTSEVDAQTAAAGMHGGALTTNCTACHTVFTELPSKHPSGTGTPTACTICHTIPHSGAVNTDTLCGQCHGGSAGPSATNNGAPYIGQSYLSTYAEGMHSNVTTPTASMDIDVSSYTVSLTDTSTDDGEFPTNAVKVKWGDGTSSTGDAGSDFEHTYGANGKYQIVYTVTDSDGLKSSTTTTVAIPERLSIVVDLSPALSTDATFVLKKNGVVMSKGTGTTSYTFTNLKPGTYQVKIKKTDYTFDGDAVTEGDQNPLTVVVGASDETVTFTHTP